MAVHRLAGARASSVVREVLGVRICGRLCPVSRASRARRIATRAAFGGGGAVGVAGGAVGVLWAQAMLARHRVGEPNREPFPVDGIYGTHRRSSAGLPPYRLVVLGDSAAAGLGADTARVE